MSLRCIQLYISIVNAANQALIFTWKLEDIGICIMCGYAAVAHFKEQPVFGILYYLMLLDGMLIYVLIYGKAFTVPALMQETRRAILMASDKKCSKAERKMIARRIMSIPSSGIKVGEFHMLERLSTPVFLHYVVSNVVSMLVACA